MNNKKNNIKTIALLLFLLLFPRAVRAEIVSASPVFLKMGFSTVIEFDLIPIHVVIGDSSSFQVERLKKSIIIKPLVMEGSTNLLVYFKNQRKKLFILRASEDANPNYYKRFNFILAAPKAGNKVYFEGIKIISRKFSSKKDYFKLIVQVSAGYAKRVLPIWRKAYLKYNGSVIKPARTWSERKSIQRDSFVFASFLWRLPNIPRNLKGVHLILPVHKRKKPFILNLGKK